MKGNVCFLEDLTRLIQAGKRTELAHRLRPEAAVVSRGDRNLWPGSCRAVAVGTAAADNARRTPDPDAFRSADAAAGNGAVRGKAAAVWACDRCAFRSARSSDAAGSGSETESAATSGRSSDLELLFNADAEILAEWDLCQDTLRVSENWFAHFHFQPALSNLFQDPARRQHSLSGAQIAEIQSQLRQGKPVPPIELSLRCGGKDFRWYKLELTAEKDGQGQPVKVLGLVSDIDQQRRELHWLRRLAHQDCLTGLYNRFKIQQLIEETLRCAPEGNA